MSVASARQVIADAIRRRVFPAAVAEIGSSGGPLWQHAAGALTFEAASPQAELSTIFDLASLTKPIATTTLVMHLEASGAVSLAEPLASCFREWRGGDRNMVTVRDLLEHASGLPARLLDAPPASRREFEHEICTIALEYAPRTRSIYSDLGFILLGFLAADRGGAGLGALWARVAERIPADLLVFDLPRDLRRRVAPALPMDDDPRRGRQLAGEVHDRYAAALGGAAGHAGLFGTAPGVGGFARIVLRAARGDVGGPPPFSPERVRTFVAKSAVPGSSRALGWDTMLPTSSCGTRMSAAAFGHVGFTGGSLWIDPERDRYFVLLTNRTAGGGTLDEMRDVRRAFHDALAGRP